MWYKFSDFLTDGKKVYKNTLEKRQSLEPNFFPKYQNVLFISPSRKANSAKIFTLEKLNQIG